MNRPYDRQTAVREPPTMKFDPATHHRRSIRFPGYDYALAGAYFVTLCTHEKKHLFGKVAGHEVTLNPCGTIIEACWLAIPLHSPNVELEPHVVMPNHVHGIVVVRRRMVAQAARDQGSAGGAGAAPRRIGALIPRSIPSIVRSFKSITTRMIHENIPGQAAAVWQRGYYEHIIRDQDEFRRTCEYIRLNPANWATDEENS